MILSAGTRVGPYEILAPLGSGGMGEVYRARDAKLGRDVALKILSDAFTLDHDRTARFKREAQLLASLNHPNIGAIYGFEDSTDLHALVLELVDGPTLADRIAVGPVPLAEALPIARQIADALDAAHEHGVIHRDLKPANVALRSDGTVKVLDFGLAKAMDPTPAGAWSASQSPTITSPALSRMGVILGTAAYMSPEQARGKVVDKRTDIWAFGCVLYEMITGQRAFPGETLTDTLAAIVEREPVWTALPDATPLGVRRLLKRCLEKSSSRRLHDAADVRIEIDDVLDSRSAGEEAAGAAQKMRARRSGALGMAAVGVVAALVAGFAAWTLKPGPAAANRLPIARLSVSLPPGDTLGLIWPAVALSPDGRQVAYTARRARSSNSQLFVRSIDGLDSTPLAGSEGALAPFFSPDGRWIGFFAQGKLKKILATGGGLETLCDAALGFGGTWGTDDSIYFAPVNTSGIWKVSASGGAPREVTRLDRSRGEVSHRWPQVSADGKVVLFTVWTGPGWDEKHLELQILESGERRALVRGASTGRYIASGHLLYARAEELIVVPFDLAQLRVTGPPVTLIERASEQEGEGAQFAVSAVGTLAYIPSESRTSDRRMVWVGPGGTVEPLAAAPGAYTDPAISPDGRFVAVSIQGPTQTIWIYDLARSTLTTLPSAGSSQAPMWTPDGRRLVYRETRAGYRNVFWRAADGSGDEEPLTKGEGLQTPSSLSPDGTVLLFADTSPATGRDVWMMRLDAARVPEAVLRTRFTESAAKLSPDGRWMAYASDESGRGEIYVRPFPNPGGKFAISTDGGSEPLWSHDGRELYYRNGDRMMAVTIAAGSTLTAGSPRLLFEGHYQVSDAGVSGYAVSSQGRFLMIESKAGEQPATRINVVLNWFDELKKPAQTDAR